MGARLPVAVTTVPYVNEYSNVRINDSIAAVAEQAFAPFSQMAVGTNATQTFASTTNTVITGVTSDLVVPVPSRVVINIAVRCIADVLTTGEGLFISLFRDAAFVTGAQQVWEPGADTEKANVAFSWLHEDLLPGNTYTYDVRARVFPRTTGQYVISGTRSTILLTTEARQRV